MIESGTVHIDLSPKPGGRAGVVVLNARTNGIARMLASPEKRAKARRLIPLLYGLCPCAHLASFDAARARAVGLCDAERRARTGALPERAVLLEAVVENLRVLVMDAGALSGLRPDAAMLRSIGRLRAEVATVLQHMAAMDPLHPEAIDTPHRMAATDTVRALFDDAREAAETMLFGMPPEAWLTDTTSIEAMEAWAAQWNDKLPAARLARGFLMRPANFGRVSAPLLPGHNAGPAFAEELLYRMMHEPGFDLAPVWKGATRLTGAIVRRLGEPLVAGLVALRGVCAVSLLAARLTDTAAMLEALRASLGDSDTSSGMSPNGRWETPLSTYGFRAGEALCLTETARGLLAHAVSVNDAGEAVRLRITSPTEWQFSPDGPGQQAATLLARDLNADATEDKPVDLEEFESLLRLALFGLDACVPLDFHRHA